MQIDLIKKEKDFMEIKIHDAGETVLIPLKNQLLEDKAILYANYNVRHPQLDIPPFYFKVGSGKPQNALKKACKALSNNYRDMLEQFNKQS